MNELRARVISQEKGIYRIDSSAYLESKREKFRKISKINKSGRK